MAAVPEKQERGNRDYCHMNISEVLTPFLSLKEPATERAYSGVIKRLESEYPSWWEMNATQATQYLADLRRRVQLDGLPTAVATLRMYGAALKSIFAHLVRCGVRTDNPFEAAWKAISPRQRGQKRPTELIPFQIVRKMLKAPDLRTEEGVRDAALLAILFGCGLRRCEAAGLNVGDIKIIERSPKVWALTLKQTKAGKRVDVVMNTWVAARVTQLVAQRHGAGAEKSEPLFATNYRGGSRMDTRTIARTFCYYAQLCGLDRAAPHAARATFATRLAAQGFSEIQIAEALRHSSTGQVHVYVKRAEGLKNAPGKSIVF